MTTNLISRIGAMRLTPVRFFGFWAVLFALVFTLSSCSDDLDVQQSYPFTVEVMPFAEKIVKGQTVELRFEINFGSTRGNRLLSSTPKIMMTIQVAWSLLPSIPEH